MNELLVRVFGQYARWAGAHPWLPLLIIAASVAGAASQARRLRLELSYENLLPADTESLRDTREARRRTGGSDTFLIAIQSPDPRANVELARALARRIAEWDETEWVMDRLDLRFMTDSALLYMDLESLREFIDLLELKIHRVQCERRGNCDTADFRTTEEVSRDENRLNELATGYLDHLQHTSGSDRRVDETNPELQDALISDDGVIAVVAAGVRGSAEDRVHAAEMRDRGEALIRELRPGSFHPELVATVSGAYGTLDGLERLSASLTALLPLLLVSLLVVIALAVRRWTAPVLVVASLLVGCIWTAGAIGCLHPLLNPLVISLLLTLPVVGSTSAIGFYIAAHRSLSSEETLPRALLQGTKESLSGALLSAVVTAAALCALVVAQTPGLRAIAALTAVGSLLCSCSAYFVIPPLWGLLNQIRHERTANWDLRNRWLSKADKRTAISVALGLLLLLGWRGPLMEVDTDMSSLRVSASRHVIDPDRALRLGRASSPAILLGENAHEVNEARRALLQQRGARDARIVDVIGVETFIPVDQARKLEENERLRELLEPLKRRRIPEVYREELEELTRLARVSEPVELSVLPVEVLELISERDETVGHFALVYHSLSFGDVDGARDFREELGRSMSSNGGRLRIASTRFIIVDLVDMLLGDSGRALLISIVTTLFLLALGLRSTLAPLASVGIVCLGVGAGLGAADFLYWKLGVLEMFAVTPAIALGLDGAIRRFGPGARRRGNSNENPSRHLRTPTLVAGLIVLTCHTALVLGGQRMMAEVGQVALTTTGFTLVASLFVLPAVSRARRQR